MEERCCFGVWLEEGEPVSKISDCEGLSGKRHCCETGVQDGAFPVRRSAIGSSFMDDFVPHQDCLDCVLSFLAYQDCLRMGSTCSDLLAGIQQNLRVRRSRFVSRFEAIVDDPCKPFALPAEEDGPSSRRSPRTISTVKTQVQTLYRALPRPHPMADQVRELREVVDQIDPDENGEETTKSKSNDAEDKRRPHNFKTSIALLRTHSSAHRLHTTILNSVMSSAPASRDGDGPYSLSQYIGDVLCVFCLLQSRESGVVDKLGPGLLEWYDELVQQYRSQPCDYRVWLYDHVMTLQICPFPEAVLERLGLSSTFLLPVSSSAMPQLRWSSHRPFFSHAELMKAEINRMKVIRVTYNDFGRLGPTFRGRDHISSQRVSMSHLLPCCFVWNTMYNCITGEMMVPSMKDFVDKWAAMDNSDDNNDVCSMIRMHEEARKNRPMTVEPPQIMFVQEGAFGA